MADSIFFAQFLGALMIIMPLGLLIHSKHIKSILDGIRNGVLMSVFGMIALLLGLFIVLNHNVWDSGLAIVISSIGWLSLIKGTVYFIFPSVVQSMATIYENKSTRNFFLLITLLLGVWLTYLGFTA